MSGVNRSNRDRGGPAVVELLDASYAAYKPTSRVMSPSAASTEG